MFCATHLARAPGSAVSWLEHDNVAPVAAGCSSLQTAFAGHLLENEDQFISSHIKLN